MTSNEEKNKLTFIQHNVNRSSPAHYSLLQQAFENTLTDIDSRALCSLQQASRQLHLHFSPFISHCNSYTNAVKKHSK